MKGESLFNPFIHLDSVEKRLLLQSLHHKVIGVLRFPNFVKGIDVLMLNALHNFKFVIKGVLKTVNEGVLRIRRPNSPKFPFKSVWQRTFVL